MIGAGPGDLEAYEIACRGHRPALGVDRLHGDRLGVAPVASKARTIGKQLQGHGFAGRLDGKAGHRLAPLLSHRFQLARFIGDLPGNEIDLVDGLLRQAACR